ncbi:MAG: aspartyl protease family protein [Tepidisphaeraceae bacterium]
MRRFIICALFALGCASLDAAPATAPTTSSADEEKIVEPGKIAFDDSIPGALQVRRATTGHLLVNPQINGRDVGWFILDTGAGMSCVDKELAEKLGLPDAGGVTARGTGGSAESRVRSADVMTLGPVRIEGAKLLELNLKPFGIFLGQQINGIIGYECFMAGVFDIDFVNAAVSVHNVTSYELASGSWAPLTIQGRRPCAPGQIENNPPGLFLLDTGSTSDIVIHAPTVERFKLLEGRKTRWSMFGGVGGMKSASSGVLGCVTLAGERLDKVSASFSKATDGAMSDDSEQATVGIPLLRQFRMFVNYPQKQIALVPIAKPPSTLPTTQP